MDTNNISVMTMDSVTAFLKAAEFTAQKNDRYLFVLLLFLGIVGIAIVAKWLAGQYNRILKEWREDMGKIQAERREDMQKYATEILRLHAQQVTAAEEYAKNLAAIQKAQSEDARALLKDYAAMMAENARTMGAVAHALTDLQHSCAMSRQPQTIRPAS
jgi:hypothetical protein